MKLLNHIRLVRGSKLLLTQLHEARCVFIVGMHGASKCINFSVYWCVLCCVFVVVHFCDYYVS